MTRNSLSLSSVGEIVIRIFTGVVILGQTLLLDYFMVSHNGPRWLGWIVVDLVVLCCFITLNIFAFLYFFRYTKPTNPHAPEMGLLPYAFIVWIIYSVVLAAKVGCMFKTFARELPAEGWEGTNTMKIAIGMSAGIFALLIAGHHRTRASERHKFCLKWMQTHVVFELLDTVDFLGILFINEDPHLLLSFEVENAIIAYSCINLVVPSIALYQLSRANFARTKPKEDFTLIQMLVAAVFVNFPYVVIRLYLWHTANFTTAMFIMKNFIALFSGFWELRKFLPCYRQMEKCEKDEEIQMHDAPIDKTQVCG